MNIVVKDNFLKAIHNSFLYAKDSLLVVKDNFLKAYIKITKINHMCVSLFYSKKNQENENSIFLKKKVLTKNSAPTFIVTKVGKMKSRQTIIPKGQNIFSNIGCA